MTTQTLESLQAAKKLGSAIGGTDPAIVVAVKDANGNAAPIVLTADGKIPVAPGAVEGGATEAKQDAGNASLVTIAGKDFATQTTLAAVLAKLSADPATQTTLAAVLAAVQAAVPAGSNLIGKVGIDQTSPGTSDRATVGKSVVVDVTLSLDTSAYSSGDVLADTQAIANMVRANDFGAVLQSVTVIDKDDQGAAFDIYFLDANNAMGNENGAPSISDANAAAILGKVSVATTDYVDLGGVKVATINVAGLPLKPASGGTTGYLAVVNGTGTPTYTASGVVVRLGLLQD